MQGKLAIFLNGSSRNPSQDALQRRDGGISVLIDPLFGYLAPYEVSWMGIMN